MSRISPALARGTVEYVAVLTAASGGETRSRPERRETDAQRMIDDSRRIHPGHFVADRIDRIAWVGK